jgi:acylphosphatase
MDHAYITFEVAKNPSREPKIKHREDGEIEIVFQMTQEQMDEVMIKNLKKRPK